MKYQLTGSDKKFNRSNAELLMDFAVASRVFCGGVARKEVEKK